jgi:hypothetical protein
MGQTQCRVVVEGRTVEEILSFDYSSDVMAIAEEAHFSVENKNRKYRDQLRLGQHVEFILQNPDVNGGAPTVKHRGVIVRRNPKINPSEGSVINITSADLGWHIQNSDAPLWMRLQGKTFADICDPATSPFFDKSWGFTGLDFTGQPRRRLKLGLAAALIEQQRLIQPVHVIQIEPGEKPSEKITEYARRINLLLNVSPDGKVCLFRPNDQQAPLYSLRLRAGDEGCNVLDADLVEVAQAELLLEAELDAGRSRGYLARDEVGGAARGLVVEEYATTGKNIVTFTIVHCHVVCICLSYAVWRSGVEWCCLFLWYFMYFTKQLTC